MACRTRLAWIVVLALVSPPAGATVVAWRATGVVGNLQGNTSLLPLPGAPGDEFVLEFSYDDAGVDSEASANLGRYPILSLVVRVAAQSLTIVDETIGEGSIHIQANSVSSNVWSVSGCNPCGATEDEARFSLFMPEGAILSDVLTPPPDPAGASAVQFLLRSTAPGDEAFLVGSLESLQPVPEPGASPGALAVLTALAWLRRVRGARPPARRRIGSHPA